MSENNEQPPLVYSPVDGHKLTTGYVAADQYRWPRAVWRINPWTGTPRHQKDIASDPQGLLTWPDAQKALDSDPHGTLSWSDAWRPMGVASKTFGQLEGTGVQLLAGGGYGESVRQGAAPLADIRTTLNERGTRYGPFKGHADVTQQLKRVIFGFRPGLRLEPDQREALEMIAHKIGRIVNGDPDYADSWVDIAGYAQLVADRLNGKVT